MEYRQNSLSYEEYCSLRKSVGWQLFSQSQTQQALANSLYTVSVVENNQTVGMGRLTGDGMYFLIVDVVVHPSFQNRGIGTNLTSMLLKYAEDQTPLGGRSSVQLIAEKGKEGFYEKLGFKLIPHDFCGAGMRKVIRK